MSPLSARRPWREVRGMPVPEPRVRTRAEIAAELRRLRLASGLTLLEVADGMGTHRPIVGRDESGRHTIVLARLRRYAVIYGVSLDALLRVTR